MRVAFLAAKRMTGKRGGSMTNLKRIIDEKGVQQRWLAEAVGVTEVSMSRYVSGERIPKAPIAIRMADALGVNVKDLYGWESEKRTEERTETHACDCNSRSAQPERLTDDDFETIRIHLNAQKEKLCNQQRWEEANEYQRIIDRFMAFASAQPEIVLCKDCKHWKDSDGVYRRGIGAESKCPVNIRAVYEGNFYCADAERRTDET